jgi:hypothetical protein
MPDDTSPENVQRFVRMHKIRSGQEKANLGPELTREAAQQEIEAKNPKMSQRFATGVRARMKEMAAGGKKLYRDLTPEEQADLNAGRATRSAAGPAANVGSAALDAAVLALPLSRAATLASVPARIAASGAIGAGGGALLNPENRGKHAAIGGISAAIPTGLAATPLAKAGLPEAMRAVGRIRNSPFLKGAIGSATGAGVGAAAMGGIPTTSLPIVGAGITGASGLWGLSQLARARPGVAEGLVFGAAEEAARGEY